MNHFSKSILSIFMMIVIFSPVIAAELPIASTLDTTAPKDAISSDKDCADTQGEVIESSGQKDYMGYGD